MSPQSQICEEEFELMRELFKRNLNPNLGQTDESSKAKSETVTKTIDDQTASKSNDREAVKTNGYPEEMAKCEHTETQVKMRRTSSDRRTSSALIEKVLHNNNDNQTEQLDNEQKMLLLLGDGKDGQQISKEELEKRQNYLRAQRDKLIELKRKERSKQIEKAGDEEQQNNRPKSAKALKSSLRKSFSNDDDESNSKDKPTNENKENNGYRRMLAAKLKAELIGGNVEDVILVQSSTNQN